MTDIDPVIKILESCVVPDCQNCPMGNTEGPCSEKWVTVPTAALWTAIAYLKMMNEEEPQITCSDCQYFDKRDAPGGLGWCKRPGAGCGQPEDFWCAAAKRKEARSNADSRM